MVGENWLSQSLLTEELAAIANRYGNCALDIRYCKRQPHRLTKIYIVNYVLQKK